MPERELNPPENNCEDCGRECSEDHALCNKCRQDYYREELADQRD